MLVAVWVVEAVAGLGKGLAAVVVAETFAGSGVRFDAAAVVDVAVVLSGRCVAAAGEVGNFEAYAAADACHWRRPESYGCC